MDIQKAIEWMKDMKEYCEDVFRPVDRETSSYIIMALRELEQYRQIGTLEENREARVKQRPKKPKKTSRVVRSMNKNDDGHLNYVSIQKDYLGCHKCGGFVGFADDCYDGESYRYNYCPDCGQRIDWSDDCVEAENSIHESHE